MSDGVAPDAESGTEVTCFVIGPIGDRLAPTGDDGRRRYEEAEELWEYVIQPACAVNALSPIRADKISHPGEIPEQIFELLRDADVVIADLTGGNANVMYELGLRHTRDKITIQIGENERLPFDINTIRTFRFRRTSVGLTEVRDELTAALRAGLEGRGSPVTATRVWSTASTSGANLVASARAREEAVAASTPVDDDDDDDEPGLIDVMADGEAALGSLTEIMTRLNEAVVQMGELATEFSGRLTEADETHGSFAARLTVARQFSESMQVPTSQLEEAAADYVEALSRVDPAVVRFISAAEDDPEERQSLDDYLVNVVALARVTEESMENASTMAQVYGGLSKSTTILKPVSKRVERALRRVVSASEVMNTWASRVRSLPDWDEERATAEVGSWAANGEAEPDQSTDA